VEPPAGALVGEVAAGGAAVGFVAADVVGAGGGLVGWAGAGATVGEGVVAAGAHAANSEVKPVTPMAACKNARRVRMGFLLLIP
jgi:hypothetical protein